MYTMYIHIEGIAVAYYEVSSYRLLRTHRRCINNRGVGKQQRGVQGGSRYPRDRVHHTSTIYAIILRTQRLYRIEDKDWIQWRGIIHTRAPPDECLHYITLLLICQALF